MQDRRNIINIETLIPLGMLSVIIGFSTWLTTVWATGQSNSQDIKEIKIQRKEDMADIKKELIRMSEKLDKLLLESTKK